MKLHRKDEDEVAIDMSPMIDMVFLLLIFFIVASAVIKVEPVKIEIPSAVYAKVPEDETGRAMITLTAAGDMYVGPTQKLVTLDELKEWITLELEADKDIRILIRADGMVRYRDTEEIMEACAEVGASDMIFAAFESGE
ncbi:MAG: biopolymer transporter ExbD [Kiritimatiellaeota bacterium]|nr:biopolymer transporter ExbD [Kiritimatiellota bacterium]